MATTIKQRIPVRTETRQKFIEEKRRVVAQYEKRYEMTSEELANLFDRYPIEPTPIRIIGPCGSSPQPRVPMLIFPVNPSIPIL